MRILIDGYNLMHAVGLLHKRYGPDGFRKARHRFLNDLAAGLDPVEAHQTTVVFDAATYPDHLPARTSHKGMTILFAIGDENADARLEQLIAKDSAPKTLKVVSSDHRVREAAARRKAKAVSSDDFWDEVRRGPSRRAAASPRGESAEERGREHGPTPEEAAFWLDEFREVAESPELREASRPADFVPTDEEIARIAREVEEEDL